MAELETKMENKTEEKKEMKKEVKVEEKIKKTANETKTTDASPNKEQEKITSQDKKKVEVAKKYEAITKGTNLHASMRQCMYICRFIKNKSIDDAIKDLEDVILYKKIVPFKGEIPHRKGKIMSGRYPINVSKLFIPILKTLKGNVLANKMELDKTKIYFASACYASRPSKKGGGRFKRANLVLKAKEAVK